MGLTKALTIVEIFLRKCYNYIRYLGKYLIETIDVLKFKLKELHIFIQLKILESNPVFLL